MHQLTFIACRRDGLGERLRGILNAMIVAEKLGGRFLFHWPARKDYSTGPDALPPADHVFSRRFMEMFHISEKELQCKKLVNLVDVAEDLENGNLVIDSETLIVVGQTNLAIQAGPLSGLSGVNFSYSRIFERLGFSDHVMSAQKAANNIEMPQGAIAVHLRAGDIIYGQYRYTDRYHTKVVPLPLAARITEEIIANGKKPIIFSQDHGLNDFFFSRFSDGEVVIASTECLDKGFSYLQETMFEIFLMSRCQKVFAGASGFARLAGQISNIPVKDPRRIVDPQEAVQTIENFVFSEGILNHVSPLQIAFACRSAFVISGHVTPPDLRFQKLLDYARALDPNNGFYHFVQMCKGYESGAAAESEDIFQSLIVKGGESKKSLLYVLNSISFKPEMHASACKLVPILFRAAQDGHPMAALGMAVILNAQGKLEEAAAFVDTFLSNSSEETVEICKGFLPKAQKV